MTQAWGTERNADSAVDFAIVTAKTVERDAILSRLDSYERIDEPDSPYVYYRGQISIPDTDRYEVVVIRLIDQGNVEAAAEATKLIQRWQPRYVLMVGIAGGIAQNDVAIGDVVVAEYVHYYEPGKRRPGGEERRPKHYRSDRLLFAKAQNYEDADWKGYVNMPAPDSDSYVPEARFGPIGSGEQVVADPQAIAELLKECPQMRAVAMEAAGIAQAAENEQSAFLEIRGISDLADAHKNDRWQLYAANAAAAFTIGFLRSRPVFSLAEQAKRRSADHSAAGMPVLIVRAQSLVEIPPDQVLPALPPELKRRPYEPVVLDFTDMLGSDRRLPDPQAAVHRLIDPQGSLMTALRRRGEAEAIFHGLVHIPLAFLSGYLISDRQQVRLLDFHPASGSGTWVWPDDGDCFPPLSMAGLPYGQLQRTGDAVVRISVSYPVTAGQTEAAVPGAALEVDLTVPQPSRGVVTSEAQTRAYGRVFRQTLDAIARYSSVIRRVHVFYGGPVALAFHMGQQVSENVHPPVAVWNFRRGYYEWGIDTAKAADGMDSIVRSADGVMAGQEEK